MDIGVAVGSICIITMLALLAFFVYKIREYAVCWWIIPLSYTFCGLDFMRKDCLCMLFVVAILYLLRNETMRKPPYAVLLWLLTALLLNLHEAFFFVICPFATYYILFVSRRFATLLLRIGVLLPIWGMFLLICKYHGDASTAIAIQESWHSLYPDEIPLLTGDTYQGSSIAALAWETRTTIEAHLAMNYLNPDPARKYGYIILPLLYVTIFYVITRYAYLFSKSHSPLHGRNAGAFALLAAFQFASLSPMFFGLSCDLGRICAYWTLSSLFILFVFGQEGVEKFFPPSWIAKSECINDKADAIIRHPRCAVGLLIFSIGVPVYGYTGFARLFLRGLLGSLIEYPHHILQTLSGQI